MIKVYVVLRNGELYHGVKKKSKTVKAYTSRGMAEGIVKRDTPTLASREYHNLDIKYEEAYQVILNTIESQFEVKELTL